MELKTDILLQLKTAKMPYGKYEGRVLKDIPTYYLEWMAREKKFPNGKLGMQLHTLYEIKINGLEKLLDKL